MTVMSDKLKETLGIIDRSESSAPQGLVDQETGEIYEVQEIEPSPPAQLVIVEKSTAVPEIVQTDIAEDYKHARNLTYTMLGVLGEAVAGAAGVAKESEHPRAYSVLNELAGTFRQFTQDLLNMQKAYKEVTKDRPETVPPVAQTNNTQNNFYGSTTEVMRALKESGATIETMDGLEDLTEKE